MRASLIGTLAETRSYADHRQPSAQVRKGTFNPATGSEHAMT